MALEKLFMKNKTSFLDTYDPDDKKILKEKKVIGFDVVELCPNPYNVAPDYLAAKLIYKLLSYKFYSNNL